MASTCRCWALSTALAKRLERGMVGRALVTSGHCRAKENKAMRSRREGLEPVKEDACFQKAGPFLRAQDFCKLIKANSVIKQLS